MEEFVFSLLRCRSYDDVERSAAEFGPVVCSRLRNAACVAVEVEIVDSMRNTRSSIGSEMRSHESWRLAGRKTPAEQRHHVSHVLLTGIATLHIYFMLADDLDLSAIATVESALKVVLNRLVCEAEEKHLQVEVCSLESGAHSFLTRGANRMRTCRQLSMPVSWRAVLSF
jgi:hypothetical protein